MTRPRFIYYVAASLDGFLADEHGRLDWLFRFDDAEGVKAHYERFIAGIGAIMMGRSTWDFIAGPSAAPPRDEVEAPADGMSSGHPWPYADIPTWVLTHRVLEPIATAKVCVSTSLSEAAQAAADAARAVSLDVWIVGGGQVAAQALAAGYLDELRLGVVPLFLGRGIPLLPLRTPELELVGQTTFGRGLVELVYRFPESQASAIIRPDAG